MALQRMATERPHLNVFQIRAMQALVQDKVGIYHGWILPIWDDIEDLYLGSIVPGRWNKTSDITVMVIMALGDAEDVGDKFQLRLSWEHSPFPGVVLATSNDVDVETTVVGGRAAQYNQYMVAFTIDYNIDGGGNEIKPWELIGMRLRRIAATELEVDNDPLVMDWHWHFTPDKMYASHSM